MTDLLRIDDLRRDRKLDLSLRLGNRTVTATVAGAPAAHHDDLELLRWYLEDYDDDAQSSRRARELALRARSAARRVGEDLYRSVFGATPEAAGIGALLEGDALAGVTVEIRCGGPAAFAVPWELLRDPTSGRDIAVHAKSFVRAVVTAPRDYRPPVLGRVLVVVSRPGRESDVPLRSVAGHIVRAGLARRNPLAVTLLRPPTLDALRHELHRAADTGAPYSVVHFDGHGIRADAFALDRLEVRTLPGDGPPPGAARRGYLIFEGGPAGGSPVAVSGTTLGRICAENRVGTVLLNACRSAEDFGTASAAGAYGTVAQELLHHGVHGVVAMRYNVSVGVAADVMRTVYGALFAGRDLGSAVAGARRAVATTDVDGLGWVVPVVYAPAGIPVVITPEVDHQQSPAGADAGTGAVSGSLDATLLALDRAFDHACVVVLNAWAGSGGAAVAHEFIAWYQSTGAASLEAMVLMMTTTVDAADLRSMFDGASTTAAGSFVVTGGDATARAALRGAAEDVIARPTLVVVDDFDAVSFMPDPQRQQILDVLRSWRDPRVRVLVVSGRDDRSVLGEHVAHVPLEPPDVAAAVQLAVDAARGAGRDLTAAEARDLVAAVDANPLLTRHFAAGYTPPLLPAPDSWWRSNPALRLAAEPPDRVTSVFRALLESHFTTEELTILSVTALFRRYVSADGLSSVLDPPDSGELQGRIAHRALEVLDRAAELGLLAKVRSLTYRIHPGLPAVLAAYWPDVLETYLAEQWLVVMAQLGMELRDIVEEGYRHVVDRLALEESNLLAVREEAMRRGDWVLLTMSMQGLRALCVASGRLDDWADLLDGIDPLLQRTRDDARWATEVHLHLSHRAEHAFVTGDLARARQEQSHVVAYQRRLAEAVPNRPAGDLSGRERTALRGRATAEELYGRILQHDVDPRCFDYLIGAHAAYQRLDDGQAAGVVSLLLADACLAFDRLDEAERWIDAALLALNPHDSGRRSAVWLLRGRVGSARIHRALHTGAVDSDLLDGWLAEAVQAFHRCAQEAPGEREAAHALLTLAELLNDVQAEPDLAAADAAEAAAYFALDAEQVRAYAAALFEAARGLAAIGRTDQALLNLDAVVDELEASGNADHPLVARVGQLRSRIAAGNPAPEDPVHDAQDATTLAEAALAEAGALMADGQVDAALRRLRDASDLGNPSAQYLLASVLETLGDRQGSAEWMMRAAQGEHPEALTIVAVDLHRAGDREGAEPLLRAAASHGDTTAMYILGGYHFDRAEVTEAERWWQQAAEHDDGNAMSALGGLLLSLDRYEDAERWLRRGTDRGHPHAMDLLADLLSQRGDRAAARKLRRRAKATRKKLGPPTDLRQD